MTHGSRRAALAMGLSAGALLGLVGRAFGQAGKGSRPATAPTPGPAAGTGPPRSPLAAIIGTISIESVVEGYDRTKALAQTLQAAALSKQNDLMRLQNEGKQLLKLMESLKQDHPDYRQHEEKITLIRAQIQAGEEQLQRDLESRRSESIATLHEEIRAVTARIAQRRGLTHVVKIVSKPPRADDPESVASAVMQAFLYADPRTDISADVVAILNQEYHAKAAPRPQATKSTKG